jgi:Lhr-like helicase
MIKATRSIRMAVLAATLALFIAASLPSWAGDSHLMKTGPTMTPKQATALISVAKTAKDHQKLAKYFSQQADASEAEAKDHEAMIEAYRKSPGGDRMIEHCESLVKSNLELAKAFREMAAGHQGMAKEAR